MSVGKMRLDNIFATEKDNNMEVKLRNYNYCNQEIQLKKNKVMENIQVSINVSEEDTSKQYMRFTQQWETLVKAAAKQLRNDILNFVDLFVNEDLFAYVPQAVPDVQIADPFLRIENSEMTKAKPDFCTDDPNLVTLPTNEKIHLYSQAFNNYFDQRRGQFETKINHGMINLPEFVRLYVNHTQARLIRSVAKTCKREMHLAYQSPNIEFSDYPQISEIEYMKEPFIGKLSVIEHNFSHYFSHGQSNTQFIEKQVFPFGDMAVHLIATAGIGHFPKILSYITDYDDIRGICILPESIYSRLEVMMRFCIREDLSHLPCFNIANYTNYNLDNHRIFLMHQLTTNGTLGDTTFLEKLVYYLANKSVCYLPVDFIFKAYDREIFDINRMTSIAMVEVFKGLYLHIYQTFPKDYIETNDTRSITVKFTNHLADMITHIQRQNDSVHHLMEEDQKPMGNILDLKEKLGIIIVMDEEMTELEYPRALCTSTKWSSLGKFQNVLKPNLDFNCPTKCYIESLETAVLDNFDIIEELKIEIKEKILEISSRFRCFLKGNAIHFCNDTMNAFINYQIKNEKNTSSKLKETESLKEKYGGGHLLFITTIFSHSSKHPKALVMKPKETRSDLCSGQIWNEIMTRHENGQYNEEICLALATKLTQKVKHTENQGPPRIMEEAMRNEKRNYNHDRKSLIQNSNQRKGHSGYIQEKKILPREKVQELTCIQTLELDEKAKKGLDCKSDYGDSILACFIIVLAKLVTGIGKTAVWASIFTVLTGAVTCSFSSARGDFVAIEFLISETTTAQEIALPMFSFYVDRNAATINTTEVTDSSLGCELILHIEMPHLEGDPGQIVFTAEHPSLGRGLQKFSMFMDGRNIWKEKRLCLADCHNGVKTPLLLSATTNLAKNRSIKIIPEIRNKGCKIVHYTWWSHSFIWMLLAILATVLATIFLVAIVFLLKPHAKGNKKLMQDHKDENTEKQKMIEMSK